MKSGPKLCKARLVGSRMGVLQRAHHALYSRLLSRDNLQHRPPCLSRHLQC